MYRPSFSPHSDVCMRVETDWAPPHTPIHCYSSSPTVSCLCPHSLSFSRQILEIHTVCVLLAKGHREVIFFYVSTQKGFVFFSSGEVLSMWGPYLQIESVALFIFGLFFSLSQQKNLNLNQRLVTCCMHVSPLNVMLGHVRIWFRHSQQNHIFSKQKQIKSWVAVGQVNLCEQW